MEDILSQVIFLGMPIGNSEDITDRVKKSLEKGKYFFCEDTRNLRKIFSLYEISAKGKNIYSFHENSSLEILDKVEEIVKSGNDVYYCSDAGSPFVSDPGGKLADELRKREIPFVSFSGVSSIISALENSGIAFTSFKYHGFLARTRKDKLNILEKTERSGGLHVFFESPHRIIETLKVLKNEDILRHGSLFICRELTKKFQEVILTNESTIESIIDTLTVKGEFVLVFDFGEEKKYRQPDSKEFTELAQKIIESGGKPKAVSKLVGKILDLNPKEVYESISFNKG